MNTSSRQGGFIMAVIFFFIALMVVFLFLAFFSRYFLPSNLVSNFGTGSSAGGPGPANDYVVKPNPLIDFTGTNLGGAGSLGGSDSRSQPNTDGTNRSASSGKVSLSSGTAGSSYQTFEEYLILTNNSNAAVNITGWTLTNSKGTRPIEIPGNNYVYPATESATIGTGTQFLNPTGIYQSGPIVLKPGDMAYLITGRPFSQYPLPITTSFRENICTGYLKNYPFNPPLDKSCPYPADDPQIKTVTDQCYDYLRSLGRCVDPERDDKARFDEQTTTPCKQFIRTRYTYAGCVDRSQSLSDFSTNVWRVFLGKDRELWAATRETITLYDAKGLIVDQVSY